MVSLAGHEPAHARRFAFGELGWAGSAGTGSGLRCILQQALGGRSSAGEENGVGEIVWKRLESTSIVTNERRAFTDDHQTSIRGLRQSDTASSRVRPERPLSENAG